jgi:hypothetical protein
MRILNEKYAEVAYNPVWQASVITWKDFASPEQFKETFKIGLEILENHNCIYWVEDMKFGKAVPNVVAEWVKNNFFTQVASRGVRKVAFLIEKNPMRKLYADNIKESIQMAGLQLKYFENRLDMERWIRQGEFLSMNDFTRKEGMIHNHYF